MAPEVGILRRNAAVSVDVGARIRDAVRARGYTQAAFAEAIRRDHTTVTRWMNGSRTPEIPALLVVAAELGYPAAAFLPGGPRPWDSPPSEEPPDADLHDGDQG